MEDTMVKIPQRIHVPRETVDGTQMPADGWAATICRTAIKRNTTECTKATMARLRFVRMENPPMQSYCTENGGHEAVIWITLGGNRSRPKTHGQSPRPRAGASAPHEPIV
jgi:hypothetical protein